MASPRCTARRGAALLCSTLVLSAALAGTAAADAAPPDVAPPAETAPAQAAAVQPAAVTAAAVETADSQAPAVQPAAVEAPAAETSAVDAPAPAVDAPAALEQTPDAPAAPQNRAPVAVEDRLVMVQGGSASLDLFANDSDADGDPLSLLGGTSAGHGSVSFAGGIATYTADAGFTGEDSFLYIVGDGRGASTPGTVRITVSPAQQEAGPPAPEPAPRPWNTRPAAPQTAPAPVLAAAEAAPVAVRPAAVRPAAARLRQATPGRVAVATTTSAAPMGPSTTPYVAPGGRPATLPFTGGPTDVLLPLGVGLLVAGGLATAGGRRRA